MVTIDIKSYLSYLNKLVDGHNNFYHRCSGKKPVDADYSALNEGTNTNPKAPKFKVGDRVRITKYKNIFRKGLHQNWSRDMFVIDSVLKANLWTYKINELNGEKITKTFHEKNFY